jgi:hypothetical protein
MSMPTFGTNRECKGDLEQEQLLLPDEVSMLDKEEWSLCMALSLFFLVIVLASILLFVRLAIFRVLVVVTGTIVALILLMRIFGSSVFVIALAASMVLAILVVTMLLVAQFTTTCSGKMSGYLFFWLLFILGDFLKNASRRFNGFMGTILFVSANLN